MVALAKGWVVLREARGEFAMLMGSPPLLAVDGGGWSVGAWRRKAHRTERG
jgi:hypothetical protein